jgi:spermidine synthase
MTTTSTNDPTSADPAQADPAQADPTLTHAAGRPRAMFGLVVLFSATSFIGSGLLFLVQPMVAKMLLPLLGGSAAVWNTAMVFFQAMLLAGYAYAHLSITRLGVRRQWPVQLVLLALPLALLPIAVPNGWVPPPDVAPSVWTLLTLAAMVGVPFFVLATCSPTLQRWFAETEHPRAHDPYFLYAAGNAGSLLALLAYPFVIEPRLTLGEQSRLWSILYVSFIVCCIGCAVVIARSPNLRAARSRARAAHGPAPDHKTEAPTSGELTSAEPAPPITWAQRRRWTVLALVPSALMLATTLHISTEIAAIPLLWVIPLSLYLTTFIIAFGRRGTATTRFASRALRLLIIPVALTLVAEIASGLVAVALPLLAFSFAALLAHGRLAEERPDARRLTEFYLWLSIGGVLGGIFGGLLAPVMFDNVAEYPLFLVLATALILPEPARDPRLGRLRSTAAWCIFAMLVLGSVLVRTDDPVTGLRLSLAVLGIACVGLYIVARSPAAFATGMGLVMLSAVLVPSNPTLIAERTFFGVHRLYRDDQGRHVLVNGSTVHGMEQLEGDDRGVPLTYYHPTGPVGQYFAALDQAPPRRMAVIGLGSGAIAAYGRPGDELTFYEIDDAVVGIATDPSAFSFIDEGQATTNFELGDGRLEIAKAAPGRYDLIVVDAFSSDAIPFHLLTTEAMELYLDRLAPGGQIMLHISNRYFDLEPVIGAMVDELGIAAATQENGATATEAEQGKFTSHWVVLARTDDELAPALAGGSWRPLRPRGDAPLFTDDRSDTLSLFDWGQVGR